GDVAGRTNGGDDGYANDGKGHRRHDNGRGAERRELASNRNSRVCTPAQVTHDRAPPFTQNRTATPRASPTGNAWSRVGAGGPLQQPALHPVSLTLQGSRAEPESG